MQQQRKFCDSARKAKKQGSSKYQPLRIIASSVQLLFTGSLSKASVAATEEREFSPQEKRMHTLGPLLNLSTIMNAFSWSFRLEINQTGFSYVEARFWFKVFLLIEPIISPVWDCSSASRLVFCQGPTMWNLCLRDFVWLWNPLAALRNCSTSNHSCFVLSLLKWLWNTPRNANADPPASCLTAAYKTDGESPHSSALFYFFPPSRHPVESVFL